MTSFMSLREIIHKKCECVLPTLVRDKNPFAFRCAECKNYMFNAHGAVHMWGSKTLVYSEPDLPQVEEAVLALILSERLPFGFNCKCKNAKLYPTKCDYIAVHPFCGFRINHLEFRQRQLRAFMTLKKVVNRHLKKKTISTDTARDILKTGACACSRRDKFKKKAKGIRMHEDCGLYFARCAFSEKVAVREFA